VDTVGTLQEARERLAATGYDAIICEHHLPDGNGLELLGWMRGRHHTSTPFLLIERSAHFSARYGRAFTTLAPSGRRLLASLHELIRSESEGILSCQIPFAAEAA
jgi:CheY-like chemotaxis protein